MKWQLGIEWFGKSGLRLSFYLLHTNKAWIGLRKWKLDRPSLKGLYVRYGEIGLGWCEITYKGVRTITKPPKKPKKAKAYYYRYEIPYEDSKLWNNHN